MNIEATLQNVLSRLDQCGLAYMITGSFASNMHGVPRTTYDADVVIEHDPKAIEKFVQNLGTSCYVSLEAVREAVRMRSMFNVVHLETGLKIDFIIKKARSFSQEEFSRRESASFLGQLRWFATPEDVILAKLERPKLGDSERQFQDALNVAKVQDKELDRAYLERWSRELGVHELLHRLFRELT